MRLRILTRPIGSIDGVSLDQFRVGEVYELGTPVACVFLAEQWAELVLEDQAVGVIKKPFDPAALLDAISSAIQPSRSAPDGVTLS